MMNCYNDTWSSNELSDEADYYMNYMSVCKWCEEH